jgi:3-oxoacyl-[acyl-carrier protein] reductase
MLKDKTVIVTGAAKGIGAAVAVAFAEKGANVVINYRNTSPDDTVSKIEATGAKCLTVQADVSKFDEAKKLIDEAVNTFGGIEVLVNNAGITRDMLLMRMSEEEFDSVIASNLKGAFNTVRHASKVMLKQKSGAVINMSSVVGIMGNVGQANYAASKAGIIGLTKSAARELGMKGVTCNAIAPGFIETDMTEVLSESVKEAAVSNIVLKKFGKTEDVARLAIFLAENRYITGQVIAVDGGMSI